MSTKVFLLKCPVQKYAWGKIGNGSEVAALAHLGNEEFTIENETPYAELWMGTHKSGPAVLAESGQLLSDWISLNPHTLGTGVRSRFGDQLGAGQLPFLFKVLSVNKSLSIQAHPNKSHAEQLHSSRPDKYPDSNHKPEMAIALTPFEVLCGFKPKQQIIDSINNVPELCSLVGGDNLALLTDSNEEKGCKKALKKCFHIVMSAEEEKLKELLTSLIHRLTTLKSNGDDISQFDGDLVLRLFEQYPMDVGCFVAYFLNHFTLQPGEAMFLEANLPHAYLFGDTMECMACSDNVVRAGLTPKFKDVSTLCEMLSYKCQTVEETLHETATDPNDAYTTIYNPPIDDFTVTRTQIPTSCQTYSLRAVDGASIILVIHGQATVCSESVRHPLSLHRGSILFVSAGESLTVNDITEEVVLFRAYCSL